MMRIATGLAETSFSTHFIGEFAVISSLMARSFQSVVPLSRYCIKARVATSPAVPAERAKEILLIEPSTGNSIYPPPVPICKRPLEVLSP